MTVSYQYKVASSTSGGFTRLLFMWRGSLYKLIYRELLLFIFAFDVLSLLYRSLLTDEQKEVFERVVLYCDTFIELIPLTFILGFYVAYVAARWWQQYQAIPWPDKCMHTIALYISGKEEHIRIVRRTLMRYLNLTLVLILRSISSAVKKRFPTLDHLTEVGFMTQTEKQMFLSIPNCDFNTYWVPCAWFIHVLKDTKAENPIDPYGVKLIMEEFNEFRAKCGLLWSYDWISIPLVYTQVVTLATYSFFLVAVVGRQYIEHSPKKMQMKIDIYLPLFTILQFFFFMGLLKVAEQLINPFGDDDEDFELNWLIDRHTKVSYMGVDTLMLQCPPLTKDSYFDNVDLVLPYTSASQVHKKKTYRGSVHFMQIPEDQQDLYLPEIIEEDFDESPTPQKSRKSSIFTNPFQRKFSTSLNTSDKEESRRCSTDGACNGKYKRSSLSPSWNRKSMDTSLNNISIISPRDSNFETPYRRPVAKHNSLTPGARKQKWTSVKERRRKSVPALLMRKDSVMLRKWSLRRESIDPQWKGIRWKPFEKNQEQSEALDVTNLSRSHTAGSEFTYVNRAYTNSPSESREPREASTSPASRVASSEQEEKMDANKGCDNALTTSTITPIPIDKDVVLNLPLHDSLV